MPVSAKLQEARTRPKIGYLSPFSVAGGRRLLDAFRDGLRERGYNDGVNIDIEARYADEQYERLPALASELVRLKIEVLFALTTPAAVAARRATTNVPIVFSLVSDPVRIGLVAALAHPGGNVTGVTDITSDLIAKRLALLKEAIPGLTSVGVLVNRENPTTRLALGDLETTARGLGLEMHAVDVRGESDVNPAVAALVKAKVGALLTVADASITENSPSIVRSATSHGLPLMGWTRNWAELGAVLSYGTDGFELQRQAAGKVIKILGGTKAGDLPVEQPTKFELVINMKAAKALGVNIPQSLMLRADEVIQ
jgi:putative ABC transport system substrate-binding protein